MVNVLNACEVTCVSELDVAGTGSTVCWAASQETQLMCVRIHTTLSGQTEKTSTDVCYMFAFHLQSQIAVTKTPHTIKDNSEKKKRRNLDVGVRFHKVTLNRVNISYSWTANLEQTRKPDAFHQQNWNSERS